MDINCVEQEEESEYTDEDLLLSNFEESSTTNITEKLIKV
jgi:hypothetical protein